jgi:enoyl-CoA hydratase/carnithine racemase
MDSVSTSIEAGIATITLARGKVNAINEPVAEKLKITFEEMSANDEVKSVILTGQGQFFSFGLDIPEFLSYSKESFQRFVNKFADLYTYMFLFPKPLIAALNGHTIAGGFMIATACDYRIMVSGKSRISLNEINFGSSLFPGSVELLRYCVGSRLAERIAYTGTMYTAESALEMGLIDEVSSPEELTDDALGIAEDLGARSAPAFASIKMLLRNETGRRMREQDRLYAAEIVDIWYSENTWKQLEKIRIHE